MTSSGDPRVDELVRLLTVEILQEANNELDAALTSVRNDMARRNLRGGVVAGAKLKEYLGHLQRCSDRLSDGLLDLARKANGGTAPKASEGWIVSTVHEFIKQMSRGLISRVQHDPEMRPVEHHQAEIERVSVGSQGRAKQRVALALGMAALEASAKPPTNASSASDGSTDALTGLFDRGTFDHDFKVLLEESARQQEPMGLVMVDVDHFKKVNDTHGHPAGDEVLREVATRLSRTVRGKGRAYRYGGEEMALLLPNHLPAEAVAVAERARRALDSAPVDAIHVTASFGVACSPEHGSEVIAVLKMADAALYDAKNLGRNLVRVSGEPAPTQTGPREPERRQPEPGGLTGEQRQKMREDYFKLGRPPVCPHDGALLEIQDTTTMGTVGRSFMVSCPMCGLTENIQGSQR